MSSLPVSKGRQLSSYLAEPAATYVNSDLPLSNCLQSPFNPPSSPGYLSTPSLAHSSSPFQSTPSSSSNRFAPVDGSVGRGGHDDGGPGETGGCPTGPDRPQSVSESNRRPAACHGQPGGIQRTVAGSVVAQSKTMNGVDGSSAVVESANEPATGAPGLLEEAERSRGGWSADSSVASSRCATEEVVMRGL